MSLQRQSMRTAIAHEDTSSLTVTLDQSNYDENETMIITLTMTCPATNGDRMYFLVWVEDENGELVGSPTEDTWDSTSDETVVYTYNTTAYTGSGTGDYTLYEYYGDVLADFDFLDDDTVSFTVGDDPEGEPCVIYDSQGNEVENLRLWCSRVQRLGLHRKQQRRRTGCPTKQKS